MICKGYLIVVSTLFTFQVYSQETIIFNDFENISVGVSRGVYDNVISNHGPVLVENIDLNKAQDAYDLESISPIDGSHSLISVHNEATYYEFALSRGANEGKVLKALYDIRPIRYNVPDFYIRKMMTSRIGANYASKSFKGDHVPDPILYPNVDYELEDGHSGLFLEKSNDVNYLHIGNHKELYSPLHSSLFSVHSFIGYAVDNVKILEVPREEYLRAHKELIENLKQKKKRKRAVEHTRVKQFFEHLNRLNKKYPSKISVEYYYKHIHKAESFVLKNNLVGALEQYNAAFEYHKPFMLDLSNARTCIYEYPKIIEKPVLIAYYRQVSGTAEWATKSYERLISKKPEYAAQDLKGDLASIAYNDHVYFDVDSMLLDKLKDIGERDQTNFRDLEYKELRHIDSTNLFQLLELYGNFDEISERTVHKEGMNVIQSVIHHSSRYEWDHWIEILYKDVKRGYYSAYEFADHVDNYFKNNISRYCRNPEETLRKVYLTESTYPLHGRFVYFDKLLNGVPQKHVDLRTHIYLEDYTDQVRKNFYNFKRSIDDRAFFLKNTMSYDFYPLDESGSLSKDAIKFDKAFVAEIEDWFWDCRANVLDKGKNVRDIRVSR